VIRLRDLTVTYPGFDLGPITLEVAAGERVALVGANGAGKSTTLRVLGGLLPDYRGTAEIAGVEVRTALPLSRAQVGVLPERLLGFGWMSVTDHLRFLAAFYPTWDAAYAHDLRERLGLPGGTKLAQLSRGMQVKLSLVSAEAFRPPLLLLDEPTSSIDPIMRGEILDLIDGVAPPGSERTVIYSSHILEDVERIAGRVVVLKQGRLVEDTLVARLSRGAEGVSPARAIYQLLTDA
jgi:ABC-2 type transport system ATP-binding protein